MDQALRLTLISPVYPSCFTTWNSRLKSVSFNLLPLAFLRRRPKWKQCCDCKWYRCSPNTGWLKITNTQITHAEDILHAADSNHVRSRRHLTLCEGLMCEQERCCTCDGLFRSTGQIFKLKVTTTSGLNKAEPSSLRGGQRQPRRQHHPHTLFMWNIMKSWSTHDESMCEKVKRLY